MNKPPFAKWVFDLALEIVHCEREGLTIDLKAIHSLIPDGVKLVAQGILDYHQLQSQESAAGASAAPGPVDVAAWTPGPPVVPLQQAAANGQLSQNAGA